MLSFLSVPPPIIPTVCCQTIPLHSIASFHWRDHVMTIAYQIFLYTKKRGYENIIHFWQHDKQYDHTDPYCQNLHVIKSRLSSHLFTSLFLNCCHSSTVILKCQQCSTDPTPSRSPSHDNNADILLPCSENFLHSSATRSARSCLPHNYRRKLSSHSSKTPSQNAFSYSPA